MKALRKLSYGANQVKVVDVPEPAPGYEQVLIKVERAGVCGTDLHILHDLFSKVKPPVTLGHEFAGVVADVGSGVVGWDPGDRVAIESEAFSCGQCLYCASGLTNLCPERLAYGYSVDGGFAFYVTVRRNALHRLPEHVTFQEGALCEPLAVAVHAVIELGATRADELVLVTGPGPIGLMVLQVAKYIGAQVVITGTEKDAPRFKIAAALGADHIVNVVSNDLGDVIKELSGGYGVDAAFECSGSPAGLYDCMASVKKNARIVQVGLSGRSIEIDMDQVALKEVALKGVFAHNHKTWSKTIDLLARKEVDLRPLVSGEFALKDWQEAFRLSESGAGSKYLICPSN